MPVAPPTTAQVAHDDQHAAGERDAWIDVATAAGAARTLPGALNLWLVADVLNADRTRRTCSHEGHGSTPKLHAVLFPGGPLYLACDACLAYLRSLAGHLDSLGTCHLCERELAAGDVERAVTARGRVVIDVSLCGRCAHAVGLKITTPRRHA